MNKTIKCGFSLSEFENKEQLSAKIILTCQKYNCVCLALHVVGTIVDVIMLTISLAMSVVTSGTIYP